MGFIDKSGKVCTGIKYDQIGNFSEGKAAVKVINYKDDLDEWVYIDKVTEPKERENILLTVKAIEGYVQFCCVAMGILQLLSLNFSKEMQEGVFRYLRTPSKTIVSEATVVSYLMKNIFRIMAKKPDFNITRFIQEKQENLAITEDLQAS